MLQYFSEDSPNLKLLNSGSVDKLSSVKPITVYMLSVSMLESVVGLLSSSDKC